MKNPLQLLLITFAVALCALITFQWVRESGLRKEIEQVNARERAKAEEAANLQATLSRHETEIQRLDAMKNQFSAQLKTNQARITELSQNVQRAEQEAATQRKQAEAYREALERANENLTKQNEDIRRQNTNMLSLAEERNSVVAKYNTLVADYTNLVARWNRQQEELARRNAAVARPNSNSRFSDPYE
jgi:septal ring factor EnvC (AmiA/AmiB activator)